VDGSFVGGEDVAQMIRVKCRCEPKFEFSFVGVSDSVSAEIEPPFKLEASDLRGVLTSLINVSDARRSHDAAPVAGRKISVRLK
jgi:hypothetical protein